MGDRKSAIEFINSGISAVNDKTNPNHLQHAYSLFGSACMADPTYGQAFHQMSCNNSDLGLTHASLAACRRALECEATPEERSRQLVNYGWQLHTLGRTYEAREATTDALAIDQTLALAWRNLSIIEYHLGATGEAVAAARRAFRIDPNDIQTQIALAFTLLFDGQYQEGFRHFEKRFEWRLQSFLQFPYPKWEGEPGKTVYLVADQGLGDTLSFSRFVEAAAKRCTFIHAQVQSELLRLFIYAFQHLSNVNFFPAPCPFPPADCWTTFVSLPSALGLTDDEIRDAPHITYPRFDHTPNWKVEGRRLHIGIAWNGSPLNDIARFRAIPFHHFLELCQVSGIQLYSLQCDDNAKDLMDAGAAALVRDLKPYIRDVTDTLSVLPHLDLVITAESALGHIAALAGKECLIPYSWRGRDYRLGATGEKLLWTPLTQTFNQKSDESWSDVFENIVEDLREKIDEPA